MHVDDMNPIVKGVMDALGVPPNRWGDDWFCSGNHRTQHYFWVFLVNENGRNFLELEIRSPEASERKTIEIELHDPEMLSKLKELTKPTFEAMARECLSKK